MSPVALAFMISAPHPFAETVSFRFCDGRVTIQSGKCGNPSGIGHEAHRGSLPHAHAPESLGVHRATRCFALRSSGSGYSPDWNANNHRIAPWAGLPVQVTL